MGELIGQAVEGTLYYAPREELERVRALPAPAVERAALFADLCRVNALYMIARAGSGHIGTSFSSLDILAWLFLEELRPGEPGPLRARDIFFSSKGHDAPALYSILTALGRLPFEQIHALRRLGGLPGHPDVGTPHIETNTGSLGMGISKAKGMILANRLQGIDGRVFVLTGDGELQEGQIWESLATAVHRRMGELTVIVDHNKLQSDTLVERTSDLGDLLAKLTAFGWRAERVDGHDLEAFRAVLARLAGERGAPKAILADTVKGRGVSFMEHTARESDAELYRFHSGAPDAASYTRGVQELIDRANRSLAALGARPLALEPAEQPRRPAPARVERLVPAYGAVLLECARRDRRIVALDADLALDTGLLPFKAELPERFFECGIAEQDMVSQAGGMALRGLLPVVHSFACFLAARPNEQIYNNASERTKIVYVASLAGLLPGGPGHSHQSVRDVAAVAAIPGLVVVQPATERETTRLTGWALTRAEESVWLRLVSVPCDVPFEVPATGEVRVGRGAVVVEGADAVAFGHGPVLLGEAWRAARILAERHGLGLRLIDLPWLNRVDDTWLREAVAGRRLVVTLDDHYLTGGQGELLAARLAELGLATAARVRRFGVADLPVCGGNDEVLRAHGLDAESLVASIRDALAAPGA